MNAMADFTQGGGNVVPIVLNGLLYDGQTTLAHEARAVFDHGLGLIKISTSHHQLSTPLSECEISAPLGQMPRSISLPGGERFETKDLDVMRRLDALAKKGRGEIFVDSMERRWRMVGMLFLGMAAACTAFYVWGIPFAAKHIAYALPAPVLESVSKQVLTLLAYSSDAGASNLPPERLKSIQTAFYEMTGRHGGNYKYKLHFRHSENIGPNAFALPSGDIVITDDLIKLAKNDREIMAVLAHEMTHVTERHGMRMVLQNSGLFILLAGLMGDISSMTSLGASLPTVLAESNYSRKFEVEADAGAAHYCHGCGWSTRPLQGILKRMAEKHFEIKGTEAFSSHPDMEKRVNLLQAADKQAGVQDAVEDASK
jgi:Zn-dependent protease with chaperone function